MDKPIRVTVWNEFHDDKRWKIITDRYPGGVHAYIGHFLEQDCGFTVSVHTLDDPQQGLSDEILEQTDVLIWYSHVRDHLVEEDRIEKIISRVVQDGMGLILLHSGIFSKLGKRLIGPRGGGCYREIEELERVFVVDRSHPIADGLPEYFEFPASEMYSEPSDIPIPDELVFLSWYAGGNVGRSGYTHRRGAGKIFCFTPGHCWYDVMLYPEFHQVVSNAVRWANPVQHPAVQSRGRIEAIVPQRTRQSEPGK